MTGITFEYWNKLAEITITISSLLAGFSIAVIANLLVSDANTRLMKSILVASILAASFFLITVFAMTGLLMITSNGYPMTVTPEDLNTPRIIGSGTFLLGIISLISIIAMSGWTKSKGIGLFTTVVAILTLTMVFFLMT